MRIPRFSSKATDFKDAIRRRVFVDKTRFLPGLLNAEDKVFVFTRPTLFMKSITLSMLDQFLSSKDAEMNSSLFQDLDISRKANAEFRAQYQGQFPVIFLKFENMLDNSWRRYFQKIMAKLYKEHSEVLSSLDETEQEHFQRICDVNPAAGELEKSLGDLVSYVAKKHSKKVIVLVDNYDEVLHNAYHNTSRFELLVEFLEDFLGGTAKDHLQVEKCFMTGLFPPSFTGLSAALGNIRECSVMSPDFSELFAFTESEVKDLISRSRSLANPARIHSHLADHHSGYYFGNDSEFMYNPWSVVQFFNELVGSSMIEPSPYWIGLGNIRDLETHLRPRVQYHLDELVKLMLLDGTVIVRINKHATLLDLDSEDGGLDNSAFWQILLHKGYLTASKVQQEQDAMLTCHVSIPNQEVSEGYSEAVGEFYRVVLRGHKILLQSIAEDDACVEQDNKRQRHNVETNEEQPCGSSSLSASQPIILAPSLGAKIEQSDEQEPTFDNEYRK